jgi:hypothetical protein
MRTAALRSHPKTVSLRNVRRQAHIQQDSRPDEQIRPGGCLLTVILIVISSRQHSGLFRLPLIFSFLPFFG